MSALSVEQTVNYVVKMKLNLLNRLLENKYTEKILIETNQLNKENSFVTTISNMLEIDQPQEIDVLVKIRENKLIDISMEEDKLYKSSDVREVDMILKIKNRTEFLNKIWAAQGFKKTDVIGPLQQSRSN